MSSFWDGATGAAGRPFTPELMAETFAAMKKRDDAERERRAQPGYCRHQDVVLHPADAAHLDGKQCPFGCGRILRGPAR